MSVFSEGFIFSQISLLTMAITWLHKVRRSCRMLEFADGAG